MAIAIDPQQVAPWPDYAGKSIKQGDWVQHPSGEIGQVYVQIRPQDGHFVATWMVRYADINSRLQLQVGDKGKAIVVPAPQNITDCYDVEDCETVTTTRLDPVFKVSLCIRREGTSLVLESEHDCRIALALSRNQAIDVQAMIDAYADEISEWYRQDIDRIK